MASSQPQQKKKVFIMDESAAKRKQGRTSHNDVLNQAQVAKRNFGNKKYKLKQRMYLQAVGKIPDFEKLPFSTQYDCEIVESYLENACLYQDAIQLMAQREEFVVIEDDFGEALQEMMTSGRAPSFMNLIEACKQHDKAEDIEMHRSKTNETYKYFTQRGASEDNAKAYSFAIAFYTGGYSAAINADATIVARRLVKQDQLYVDQAKIGNKAAMILYYLTKGLSHIDFYWGVVVRYIQLDAEDLEDYKPGEIMTWLQFSSSDKGGEDMSHFTDRNTHFLYIFTDCRSIRYFSNCSDQEDEVLFLPHSSFLVCNLQCDKVNGKNKIYLRQIELGFSKHIILWVDDNIFNAEWENKGHMEKASTLGTGVNVHFIPKSSTESAIAFLRSEFGQRLQDSNTFRIVTDMKRTNESSPSTAGARLLYQVRQLGFHQKCLIFTGHEESAHDKLEKTFGTRNPDGVKITHEQAILEKFVLFKKN